MFEFRLLKPDDYPVMLRWLSKKHVKQWWNDGDDTLEKVILHYGNTSDDVMRFILTESGNKTLEKPIGYFQYYFVSDDVIGIDQFIGEEDFINKGVGRKTIELFIDLIKRKHNPAAIVLDPSPDNKRAVRCYENVGFKHYETKMNDDGQAAYMMRFEIS
ncbi:MAG TPA: GNAT family N-acetyltransferase [Pyrinomonadaceae bacterium]|nr:GNAT family N-acetyltransferase [Pyrinomonadaceae bacterium]